MTALVDPKNMLPIKTNGQPLFSARFYVQKDWTADDIPYTSPVISVDVPMYMTGSDLDLDHFEIECEGTFDASMDEMIDGFIEDYWYGHDEITAAKILHKKLLDMANKLDEFIKQEEK